MFRPKNGNTPNLLDVYSAHFNKYAVIFSGTVRIHVEGEENSDNEDNYLLDHSTFIYVLNELGEFVDFFSENMSVEQCVQKIQKRIDPDM